jgi:hypothetical protein
MDENRKTKTQTASGITAARGRKLQRRGAWAAAVALVVLWAAPLLSTPADAALLDNGSFCVQATYGDEEFTGKAGPRFCQMDDNAVLLPPVPAAVAKPCTFEPAAIPSLTRFSLRWTNGNPEAAALDSSKIEYAQVVDGKIEQLNASIQAATAPAAVGYSTVLTGVGTAMTGGKPATFAIRFSSEGQVSKWITFNGSMNALGSAGSCSIGSTI